MLHMLYLCGSTYGNRNNGVKHNKMKYFEYSFCIYDCGSMWVTPLDRDQKELSNGI